MTRTIAETQKELTDGTISSEELAQEVRDVVTEHDKDVNAYLEVFDLPAEAVAKAGEANGALAGIPIAVKDNILIKGHIASAASKMLEGYHAPYDAEVITRLKHAGVQVVGRTNMDEFAMGGSTENSAFGATKNPRAPAYVPGGSSGGSAAAVAYGGALAALGSDTGGSIRQPAAFCGVVGLKPTYGAVSRRGLIAMASSLDQIGPITHTVSDAETVFNCIRGHDSKDSTSASDAHHTSNEEKEVKTIGVPYDLASGEGVDERVTQNLEASVEKLKKEGYEITDISLQELTHALSAYYVIMPAEVSSNLARFDGIRYGYAQKGETMFDDYALTRSEGFGAEVTRRILLGTFVLSSGYYDAYYNSAVKVRQHVRAAFRRVFKEVDVLMLPTTPTPAFKIGEKINDPLQMYFADIFTVPMNLGGVPAISVPSGTTSEDGVELPLGMQFVAPEFAESRLFAIGKAFETIQ